MPEENPDFEKEVAKHLMEEERPKKSATKKCPHCKAIIPAHLEICPSCHKGVMWYDVVGDIGNKLMILGLLIGLLVALYYLFRWLVK